MRLIMIFMPFLCYNHIHIGIIFAYIIHIFLDLAANLNTIFFLLNLKDWE